MTGKSFTHGIADYDVKLLPRADAAIAGGELEAQLVSHEMPPHQIDWCREVADENSRWLAVRDLRNGAVTGFTVSVIPTRALPGHRMLRLERLRFAPDSGPAAAAVQYLVDLARRDWRSLSVTVETFFADEVERNESSAVLERAGFQQIRVSRVYSHTLRVELAPQPEEILAGFNSSARKNIRAIAKRPVEIRQVEDLELTERLNDILGETFDRTAGSASQVPWRALIEFSRAHPDLVRIVSMVRTDRAGPEALVAFALGLNHGDHVELATTGSTRLSDLWLPFGYPLAWDLICWARTVGARWFDFGGIAPDPSQDGVRKGIHDFKRRFGGEVVEVSQNWSFEARPVRAAWVRGVFLLAERIRNLERPRIHTDSSKSKEESPG